MMRSNLFVLILILVLIVGCGKEPIPKPKGYFRIQLPQKEYQNIDAKCGYSFEKPAYAKVVYNRGANIDSCWYNIVIPRLNAKFHMTYLPLEGKIQKYSQDAYRMAYEHESKASSIKTTKYYNEERKVSGLIYDLGGDVASSLQFYMTDSADHFLRGSLYFENHPNADSLAPVLDFLREDMMHFYETLEWN